VLIAKHEAPFEAAGFAVKGVKRLWQTGESWTQAWEIGLSDPFLKSAHVLGSLRLPRGWK
jgi:hypothetical protein